jgi:hypothetical protein
MSVRAIVLSLSVAAVLPGCSSGIGEFCYDDSDCRPGLRCALIQDKRGVCTYPEAISDAAPAPDTSVPDTAPPLDVGPEAPPPDTMPDLLPDLVQDQGPAVDTTVDAEPGPDLQPPDLGVPVEAGPDGSTIDL